MLQRAKWALDDEELEVLKQRASFYGLDKQQDFDTFKAKYIDAVQPAPVKPKKEIMTQKKLQQKLADGQTQMARTYTFTSADPVIQVYCPDGYRYIKHLQLSFPAASILSNAKLYSEGNTADLEKSVARDVAYIQDTIDEIRTKIDAGVDFDTLIEQYGDDEAMKLEPYKSRGYVVMQGDSMVIESYRNACDSLTNTDMVAECSTYEGYFFVKASEISGPAPMPFEEIKAEMAAELNAMEKNIQYTNITNELIDKLTEAGDVMVDMDRFFKGLV